MVRYIFLILVLLATLIPVTPPAEAASEASWNVTCTSSHWAPNDPIVFPNQPGKSHLHTFYANKTTDAATTTQSLLNSGPSTCTREFQDADKSAYWIPALYKKSANGTLTELKPAQPKDFSMTIYYRRAGGTTGPKVTAFPQGLRMIAGDPKATTPQDFVSFRCALTSDGGEQSKSNKDFANCNSNESLMGDIKFPNCWDGKNLDSPDHKSHMAYHKKNVCPATHPVVVPQVTMEPKWKNVNGPSSSFMLSSGGGYSFHADFFSAWDPKVQAALVNQCPNAGIKCNGKKLYTDIKPNFANVTDQQIKAQTAGAAFIPKVASAATDHSNHQPAPAPAAAAAPLPQTGPLTVFSTVAGIGAMGYAYHAYRDRRRALRDSLRKRP
jgi:hypothetical protein